MIKDRTICSRAFELQRLWRRHENEGCAATNTIFAVFGIASKCGRVADKSDFNNNLYAYWLDGIADSNGATHDELRALDADERRSPAAVAIMADGLRRKNGRLVPMTDVARRSLLAYLAEKIELMSQISAFLAEAGSEELKQRQSQLRRHVAAMNAVIAQVTAEIGNPVAA